MAEQAIQKKLDDEAKKKEMAEKRIEEIKKIKEANTNQLRVDNGSALNEIHQKLYHMTADPAQMLEQVDQKNTPTLF